MISVAELSDVEEVLPQTLVNLGILVSPKITDDLYIQNIMGLMCIYIIDRW